MQYEMSRPHGKHFASLPGTAGITWLHQEIFMLEIFTTDDLAGGYFPYYIHWRPKNVCWNFTHSKSIQWVCHLCHFLHPKEGNLEPYFSKGGVWENLQYILKPPDMDTMWPYFILKCSSARFSACFHPFTHFRGNSQNPNKR